MLYAHMYAYVHSCTFMSPQDSRTTCCDVIAVSSEKRETTFEFRTFFICTSITSYRIFAFSQGLFDQLIEAILFKHQL